MSSSVFVRRAARALVVTCVLLCSVGARAAFAGIQVDNDKAQCPKAGFRTISQALAFAPPGATVVVCPGTYTEQVRMTKPGVRVVGLTRRPADVVLRVPPAFFAAFGGDQVAMLAPGTTVEALTIQGPGLSGPVEPAVTGVSVRNGVGPLTAAALIQNVVLRAYNGRSRAIGIGGLRTPGRAIVLDNRIRNVAFGIWMDPRSRAHIRNNVIIGPRRQPVNVGGGAGIIVFTQDARVTIIGNDISGFTPGGGVLLTIAGEPCCGLDERVRDGIVSANNIHDNGFGAELRMDGGLVSDNFIHDNRLNGLIVSGSGLPQRDPVRFVRNVVVRSHINVPAPFFDCFDGSTGTGTAGTANIWSENIGGTSSPPGICLPPAASNGPIQTSPPTAGLPTPAAAAPGPR